MDKGLNRERLGCAGDSLALDGAAVSLEENGTGRRFALFVGDSVSGPRPLPCSCCAGSHRFGPCLWPWQGAEGNPCCDRENEEEEGEGCACGVSFARFVGEESMSRRLMSSVRSAAAFELSSSTGGGGGC